MLNCSDLARICCMFDGSVNISRVLAIVYSGGLHFCCVLLLAIFVLNLIKVCFVIIKKITDASTSNKCFFVLRFNSAVYFGVILGYIILNVKPIRLHIFYTYGTCSVFSVVVIVVKKFSGVILFMIFNFSIRLNLTIIFLLNLYR